ncbi:MAG: hypothetical protein NUV80_00315 [Candidatus Berkelbacteria bacterium]|nr:hypothetical protein [Candidatus Berkelbacteria bacterium]
MSKMVRNSIFTLIVLALTAVGLSWNKQIVRHADPVQISNTVLSSETQGDRQSFPLKIEFTQTRVKLGQTQELKITTIANATLEIVTVYPDGSVNHAQTLRATADETGRYKLKFKLDDFSYLGVFETRVLAHSNNQEAQSSARFALQTWTPEDKAINQDGYVYPLLP